MNATLTQSTGIDWKAYHRQRAAEYRSVAAGYRETEKSLRASGEKWLASFAAFRAVVNEQWAKESELLAG